MCNSVDCIYLLFILFNAIDYEEAGKDQDVKVYRKVWNKANFTFSGTRWGPSPLMTVIPSKFFQSTYVLGSDNLEQLERFTEASRFPGDEEAHEWERVDAPVGRGQNKWRRGALASICKLNHSRKRGWWPQWLLENCKISCFQKRDHHESFQHAINSYWRYILNKGEPLLDKGYGPPPWSQSKRTLQSKEILDLVKAGKRRLDIVARFLHQNRIIDQLMKEAPSCEHQTGWMYICGRAGLGKTSSVLRSLREFHKMFSTVLFYSKLARLRKWWDGCDNQPIVCIDDPELFNTKYNMEDVQAFKGIVSEEPYWSKLRRAACSLLSTLSSSPATTHPMRSVRVEEMAVKYTPYGTALRVHVPHT